ncbi:MAG: tetratricopeptide repeat protein, partial [Candidatus Omnitrophota bacterium]
MSPCVPAGHTAEVSNSDPAKDDFILAQKAFEDQFYDISQEQMERFLAAYPQSEYKDEAHLTLGRSYLMLGKSAQALNEFDLVLSSASANRFYDGAVYWSAEAYFRGKDFKQALVQYQKLTDDFPNSKYAAPAYYSKGWCYYNLKEYEAAIDSFEAFAKKFPNDSLVADAKYKAAESVFMSGKLDEAKKRLNDFLKEFTISKKLPEAYFLSGEIDYALRDYAASAKDYAKALEITPGAAWRAY